MTKRWVGYLAVFVAWGPGMATAVDFGKLLRAPVSAPSAPAGMAGNPCLTNALPDLVISEFEVKKLDNTRAQYDITFKNIGEGCAGRFNVKLADGASLWAIVRDVGEPAPWMLRPGETVSMTGEVERSQLWVYPDQDGYASHLGAVVNHGQPVKETTLSNNGAGGKRPIRWGNR